MENERSNFERGIETQSMIDKIGDVEVGAIITYNEMSEILGFDIQKNRGPLMSARDIVFRENGVVFETIRNIGIKRAEDAAIVDAATGDVRRMQRFTRKRVKMLQCVDFNQLKAEGKIKHNTAMSIYGVLGYITKRTQVKRLESKINVLQQILPVNKTLEYFKR